LTVREIRASAFFKELGPTEYRVSLRSKGAIDVAAVARQFGGGGHKNASGFTVPGAYAEARQAVVAAVGPAIAAGLAQEPDQPRPAA
jgi:bifunctional oligoribonuclease and PAP phosphatase NrnA